MIVGPEGFAVVREYWRQVCRRAWRDTLHSAGLDSRSRVIWRVAGACVVIALIALFAPAVLVSRLAAALAGLCAFAILFVVFYCWHFIIAPAKIDKEARDKISELTALKRTQELLDDISNLRIQIGEMRIEMEKQNYARKYDGAGWQKKQTALREEIGSKIEQLSSKAEANNYLYIGNLDRPINTNMGSYLNPMEVDICIRDLDYLKSFIEYHSRKS